MRCCDCVRELAADKKNVQGSIYDFYPMKIGAWQQIWYQKMRSSGNFTQTGIGHHTPSWKVIASKGHDIAEALPLLLF